MTTDATCVRRYSFAALLALVVTLAPAAQLAAAHGLAAEASPAEALEVLSGTVNTVAIEDRIQHTNFNYRELRLDHGTIIPLNGQATEDLQHGARVPSKTAHARWAVLLGGCLTMTYFRTGNPYYHRRATVSRSCSGWEGVVPAGCGRQALIGGRQQESSQSSVPTGRGRSKAWVRSPQTP